MTSGLHVTNNKAVSTQLSWNFNNKNWFRLDGSAWLFQFCPSNRWFDSYKEIRGWRGSLWTWYATNGWLKKELIKGSHETHIRKRIGTRVVACSSAGVAVLRQWWRDGRLRLRRWLQRKSSVLRSLVSSRWPNDDEERTRARDGLPPDRSEPVDGPTQSRPLWRIAFSSFSLFSVSSVRFYFLYLSIEKKEINKKKKGILWLLADVMFLTAARERHVPVRSFVRSGNDWRYCRRYQVTLTTLLPTPPHRHTHTHNNRCHDNTVDSFSLVRHMWVKFHARHHQRKKERRWKVICIHSAANADN